MCFSATASFGASAILGAIGAVAIVKAKTNPQRVFATTPLIFSIQQFTEGLLWLSLKDPGLAANQQLLTYIYLVFAMAAWPCWIPLSVRLLEKDNARKKILNILLATGMIVTIVVILVLSLYPVKVMPMHHHLHYEFTFPPVAKGLIGVFSVLYILATVISPFLSGIRRMKWLGIVFLASYLVAVIFFNGFVVSVWCFLAALLSFVVLWIITDLRKQTS